MASRSELQIETESGEDYEDEEEESENSEDEWPDPDINFSLHYSLHTFVATVEGQASVVKGDSLVLLDDANSYWWLVRVLKTEDVGYIPAENIETPFERLARLNKFRNVDHASSTAEEKAAGLATSRLQLRNVLLPSASNASGDANSRSSSPSALDSGRRTVAFSAPTYVDHPGGWDTEEEEEGEEEEGEEWEEGEEGQEGVEGEEEASGSAGVLNGMEPDDGMSWDDEAGAAGQERIAASSRDPETPYDANDSQLNSSGGSSASRLDDSRLITSAAIPPSHSASSTSPVSVTDSSRPSIISRSSSKDNILDPALATPETRRLYATPQVARSASQNSLSSAAGSTSESPRNRQRTVSGSSARSSTPDDSASIEETGQRKKLKKDKAGEDGDDKDRKRKSSGGVLGALFGRNKKDKKDKGVKSSSSSNAVTADIDDAAARSSEEGEPYKIGERDTGVSPAPARVLTSSSVASRGSISNDKSRNTSSPAPNQTNISPHALRMQQIDQKQHAAYHQYLAQSPITVPDEDASLNYGMQAAAAVAQSSAAQRVASSAARSARPQSILLSPNTATDGGAVLSVLRMFAGTTIESDSTFKTVLLSEQTTTAELLAQAIQRFQLGTVEKQGDYCLSVKGADGEETILADEARPLALFNELNREDDFEAPTVRRSSIGSISSIRSDLSMNPAIRKLGDFSDDTHVKFFLNRKVAMPGFASAPGPGTPLETLSSSGHSPLAQSSTSTVRFTAQIVISASDLPDGLIFDSQTEAIVPKPQRMSTVRSSPSISGSEPPSPAMNSNAVTEKTKLVMFPTNATVGEVIEAGFDVFGIGEGVVEGGDEVEDRAARRKSGTGRVRYGLVVRTRDGQERTLLPSSKVIDCFTSPPILKSTDRSPQPDHHRRRSREIVVARAEDVQSTDPVFLLRRAVPRPLSVSNSRRSRGSMIEDGLLRQAVEGRGSAQASDRSPRLSGQTSPSGPVDALQQQQQAAAAQAMSLAATSQSRQDVIAAQRAASRANQAALLSASANNSRGVDLVLSDKTTIRSSRIFSDKGEQVRYSYIEADGGETYDISEIVEDEWFEKGDEMEVLSAEESGMKGGDVLQQVLKKRESGSRMAEDGLGGKLDRVLEKVKTANLRPLSIDGGPSSNGNQSLIPLGAPLEGQSRSSVASSATARPSPPTTRQDLPSLNSSSTTRSTPSRTDSRASQDSAVVPPSTTNPSSLSNHPNISPPLPPPNGPIVYRDDFGITQMLAVVRHRARLADPARGRAVVVKKPMTAVDKMLFGERVDLNTLHENARAKETWGGVQDGLDEMDRELEKLMIGLQGLMKAGG